MASPSRVLCCFHTSLSFIIFVPTLWIDLVLRLPPSSTSSISNTTMKDLGLKSINRTVSLMCSFSDIQLSYYWKIILQANVILADIHQTTMVTEWSVIWDTCVNPDLNNNCMAVNIFFDTWAFVEWLSKNKMYLIGSISQDFFFHLIQGGTRMLAQHTGQVGRLGQQAQKKKLTSLIGAWKQVFGRCYR